LVRAPIPASFSNLPPIQLLTGLWLLTSGFHFGGVLDSTLGWSAPLPFEDEGWPRKSSFKKIIGNYEAMPLAA